jgi:hypothetical protein
MSYPTEIWVPVQGYETYYEISNFGRFARLKNGERFLRKLNHRTHYLSVSLTKRPIDHRQKCIYIHQAVALHFLGPRPSGNVVRHLDGNRYNNHVSNLCYGTPEQNYLDTITHKTHKGENNGRAKLNATSAILVKLLLQKGAGLSEIAKAIGVTPQAIYAIKIGRNWASD